MNKEKWPLFGVIKMGVVPWLQQETQETQEAEEAEEAEEADEADGERH